MNSPLDQFLIKPLIPIHVGGLDISLTNSSMFMLIVTFAIIALQYYGLKGNNLVPNRIQALFESSYDFIAHMVDENCGKEARPFAPLVFSLFMFVLFANLFGMLPYSFTVTSHFAVTFSLALIVFLTVTVLGFVKHGTHFFSFFCPPGAPLWITPLLVPMEIISFLIRPITLSVRLFLNMTAGHILLKVFAGFAVTLGGLWFVGPVLFNTAFIAFEFFVALLQAYIFTILTCIYLNDAIHLH